MSLKAAIINLGSKSSKWTAQAMNKYFDEVDDLDLNNVEINFSGKNSEVLYEGKPLGKYDCIFAKGSFRYAPLLRSITSLLWDQAYMCMSADSFTIGHDKLLTQLKLQQHNIPMPRTYLSATSDSAKMILEKVHYPIVMKFPQGTQGKGIMFADSYSSASSMLDALSALRQPFIIQEFVETGGTDIRAIVVGDEVVAAMKRKADVKEARANIHVGGVGEMIELDSYAKKVAIQAAKAVGAEICGVDLLETVKGPVVIEVNLSPGLQGITEVCKVDVADKFAKYLYEATKVYLEKRKNVHTAKILEEVGVEKENELISSLDFRGVRILLPEIATRISKLKDTDDVHLKITKNRIVIDKFEVS